VRWKSLYLMICMCCESFFVDDLRKWPNDPYGRADDGQLAPKAASRTRLGAFAAWAIVVAVVLFGVGLVVEGDVLGTSRTRENVALAFIFASFACAFFSLVAAVARAVVAWRSRRPA
jgi:hypothetical protein